MKVIHICICVFTYKFSFVDIFGRSLFRLQLCLCLVHASLLWILNAITFIINIQYLPDNNFVVGCHDYDSNDSAIRVTQRRMVEDEVEIFYLVFIV